MVLPCVEGKVCEDTVPRREWVWIPCVKGKVCVDTVPRREWVWIPL